MFKIYVSVVMAVYNAEKYLGEAIESLLKQTFRNFELIVVNDGSTDRSLEIINSYKDDRIVVVNQKNCGVSRASNNGIDRAKSKIIARLDSDDIALPERLLKQYEFLMNNKEYVAVGSNAIIIDADGNYVHNTNLPISNEELKSKLPNSPFINSSAMFRKETYIASGKYCNDMVRGGDRVIFNRMAKFGKFYNFKEPLVKYRIVPNSISVRGPLGGKFQDIILAAINNNQISKEDRKFLESIGKSLDPDERMVRYHLHLSKKYLWDNYKPRLARQNLIKCLKVKFSILALLLLIMSYFSAMTIKKIYRIIKFEL